MPAHAREVESALSEIQEIREAISDLASIEDEALLQSLGIRTECSNISSESDKESSPDQNSDVSVQHSLVK